MTSAAEWNEWMDFSGANQHGVGGSGGINGIGIGIGSGSANGRVGSVGAMFDPFWGIRDAGGGGGEGGL